MHFAPFASKFTRLSRISIAYYLASRGIPIAAASSGTYLVVGLYVHEQGRDHGHGLLATDGTGVALREEALVELPVRFAASDVTAREVQLVGESIRIPGVTTNT